MRPNSISGVGIPGIRLSNQHADEAKVRDTYLKAIALAADLRKETPKDDYLLADVGSYYAALGREKESLPLLAQAAALAPDIPEVLYQVAVGYEMLHHRDEALRWIAKSTSGGYPPEPSREIRNWLPFARTRGTVRPRRKFSSDAHTKGDDSMFIQPAHSSSEIAFSEPFVINSMWCAANPNVDRSAPPRPAKKKTAKRKLATKKTVKRR